MGTSHAHRFDEQSTLQEAVEDFFTTALAEDLADVTHDYAKETNKDHGRLQVRRRSISEKLQTLSDTHH